MKYLFIGILVNFTFCAMAQNIYVKIDTRKKEICDTTLLNSDKCIDGENRIYYHIFKSVHEKQYQNDLRLEYHPYSKEYVKGSILKAHRTRKMSKVDLKSNLMYKELALVIDFDWIEAHSWFVIDWMARAAKHIYIIDEKNTTKDSLQIREVDYVDTATQD
ncbi:hypothetical protein [Labilibaculum euxinus]